MCLSEACKCVIIVAGGLQYKPGALAAGPPVSPLLSVLEFLYLSQAWRKLTPDSLHPAPWMLARSKVGRMRHILRFDVRRDPRRQPVITQAQMFYLLLQGDTWLRDPLARTWVILPRIRTTAPHEASPHSPVHAPVSCRWSAEYTGLTRSFPPSNLLRVPQCSLGPSPGPHHGLLGPALSGLC